MEPMKQRLLNIDIEIRHNLTTDLINAAFTEGFPQDATMADWASEMGLTQRALHTESIRLHKDWDRITKLSRYLVVLSYNFHRHLLLGVFNEKSK